MKLNFAKKTEFGWHVELARNEIPFSLRVANHDIEAAFLRKVTDVDFNEVEALLESDPEFDIAVSSLGSGNSNPFYPSLEIF